MTYPRGPGYPGHREAYLRAMHALLAASHIFRQLGRDQFGMPTGIPFGPIAGFAEAALAEQDWQHTRRTLREAQRKETRR